MIYYGDAMAASECLGTYAAGARVRHRKHGFGKIMSRLSPFYSAYYNTQLHLQMEPAQLLVSLCVNVLGVNRAGLAKHLGVSTARLSQYANGVDPVPNKRRRDVAVFAKCAAWAAEQGFREFEYGDGPVQNDRVKRVVGSLMSNVAREIEELAEIELYSLGKKGPHEAGAPTLHHGGNRQSTQNESQVAARPL